LEIGPKPTLLGMAEPILDGMTTRRRSSKSGRQDDDATALVEVQMSGFTVSHPVIPSSGGSPRGAVLLPSLREGQSDWQQMVSSLGALYGQGVAIDWATFDRQEQRRKLVLPTYPFQRQRYWLDAPKPQDRAAVRPLIDKVIQSPALQATIFEREFSTAALPFLADHRVYDKVVSPGACQLGLALSAAALHLGREHEVGLIDVILPQALVLSADGARTVQAIFTPTTGNERAAQYTFNVISFAATTALATEPIKADTHATGRVSAEQPPATVVDSANELATWQQRCDRPGNVAAFYTKLDDAQIALGPSFRWIRSLWQGQDQAAAHQGVETLAQLQRPDTLGDTTGYLLHPGLLDACFQVAGATRAADPQQETLLPFALAALHLHQPATGDSWWCHATPVGPYKWDLQLLDSTGGLVATLTGFEVRPATAEAIQGRDAWHDWLYQVTWQPRPYWGLPPAYLPTPSTVAPTLAAALPTLWAQQQGKQHQTLLAALEALSLEYVLAAFAQASFTFQPGTTWRTEQLARQLSVVPSYHRLFERLLAMLVEAEILRPERDSSRTSLNDSWRVLKMPTAIDPTARRQALQVQYGNSPELTLLARCGESLREVLRGVQEPLALLFPGGDTTVTTQLYTESPYAQVMNGLVQQVVRQAVAQLPAERGIRLLEIGAGTGGTTAGVLPLLPAAQTEYLFTDIGPAFLSKAQARFAGYGFVRYQPLDIEQPPTGQGFRRGQADLILAANVLHATRNLRDTLSHVHQLLQPGGQLVLVEGTKRSRWVDLTFGLTDGWWRFADSRQEHPLLTASQWQTLLADNGFYAIEVIEQEGQAVIVAQAAVRQAHRPLAEPAEPVEAWVLFADHQGVAAALADQLQQRGEDAVLVYADQAYHQSDAHVIHMRPDSEADYQRLLSTFPQLRGIVHLWSLDTPEAEVGTELVAVAQPRSGAVLHLVQALLQANCTLDALWLVTRNAQSVNDSDSLAGIAQSGLWGMGKVIALEHPELHCMCVDLDAALSPTQQAASLCAELVAPALETQIALRSAARYVARLAHFTPLSANRHLSPQATYLITGGLSGLGLATAEWLASQGATQLLLMGRSQPTSAAEAQLTELRNQGISVTVAQADVTNRVQVQATLDSIDPAYPLRGIIHAAGVLDDGALMQQSWARFAKVLAPKIQGAWHLHELSKALPLDFFVLFSSSASLLGKRGQANHAAANAMLDALAHFRRAQGLPALTINWGGWSEIGSAAELIRTQQTELASQGVGVIAPQQGIAALASLIAQPVAQVAVMPMQWSRYLATSAVPSAFLADFVDQVATASAPTPPTATPKTGSNIRERLSGAPAVERSTLLRTHIQQVVAQILGLPNLPAVQVGFQEMGLDSLMSIELKNRLERALQLSLPSTLAFEFPTVAELSTYILQNCLQFPSDSPPADATSSDSPPEVRKATASTPAEASDVSLLSSEDLLSFIAQEFEQAFQ
ncbi:MAG: SDR family NAD(P)-dependent oxidoreductase, partial [Caldilineaceae bacterium]